MRMQAGVYYLSQRLLSKIAKGKNPGGLVSVGEKCQLYGNLPHVVSFPSAVFSVRESVCACECVRETDRQGRGVSLVCLLVSWG